MDVDDTSAGESGLAALPGQGLEEEDVRFLSQQLGLSSPMALTPCS